MPIFDYVCYRCGFVREVIVMSSNIKPVVCEDCEQEMDKKMPAPGLLVTNFQNKPSVKTR